MKTSPAPTSAFAGLVNDLAGIGAETETMAKAIEAPAADDEDGDKDGAGDTAADDANIAAAAADGDKDDDKDGPPMAKSFQITLEDGSTIDAVDGAELIKSLTDRVERNEAETKDALTAAVGVIKQQGDLIKSLAEKVGQIGNQGTPRKAVLSVSERPAPVAEALTKSHAPEGMTSEEFLGKCLEASAAGRISSHDVSTAEVAIGMGLQPDPRVVRAVIGG